MEVLLSMLQTADIKSTEGRYVLYDGIHDAKGSIDGTRDREPYPSVVRAIPQVVSQRILGNYTEKYGIKYNKELL